MIEDNVLSASKVRLPQFSPLGEHATSDDMLWRGASGGVPFRGSRRGRARITAMDPTAQFASVVVMAFLFGVASAPYGLALALHPVVVAIGVFLGSAAFVAIMVPAVLNLVPDANARRARRVILVTPRLARRWQRVGGRIAGGRTAVAIDRTAALVDRLGIPGIAMLSPVLGRWLVPAAGLGLGIGRTRLVGWAVAGCAAWSVGLTTAFGLLVSAFS